MSIKSEIIADSKNIAGNRLTTFILEYPRYIHSEICTHRVFSKNAASSRAIPIEKMIQQVIDNPAMPTHWGKNQSGMQANEELSISDEICCYDCNSASTIFPANNDINGTYYLSSQELAKKLWLQARDRSISYVEELNKLGLHKQIANRLLEPWFNIRIILSGTEFENFFALRAHKDAHPDLQKLAYLMLEQYNNSTPKLLQPGEWHIPFGDKIENERLNKIVFEKNIEDLKERTEYKLELAKKIAVARCARISYLNYEGKDDYEADIKLCDRLFGNIPRHLSPAEHVAQALDTDQWEGNFCGFIQYRKMFKEENLSDSRVIKK